MLANRKTKSNRAQADYFELLVCQHICHLYHVTFSYSKDLANLSSLVLKLPDGKKRLQLQNQNLLKLVPRFKKILDFEIKRKGRIVKVEWVGRRFVVTQTTSDVDAHHFTKKKTRFSIKSIMGGGTGTIKNLGMESIKKYLSIDFAKQYEQMFQELRKCLNEPSISKSGLKDKVNRSKSRLAWAQRNGKKYQEELNDLCKRAFNGLPIQKKIEFLNFILDAKDPDLYVIIANDKGVVVYKPIQTKLILKDKIEARKNSDVGYTIFINNVPTYRVQTNNTNGIGISAFCQRVFKV